MTLNRRTNEASSVSTGCLRLALGRWHLNDNIVPITSRYRGRASPLLGDGWPVEYADDGRDTEGVHGADREYLRVALRQLCRLGP